MEFKKIGKIFDAYDVKFPVNTDFAILHGDNGTGKTKTLEKLVEYYENEGENVLYFETDRCYNVSKEDVESLIVMAELTETSDIRDIMNALDMKLNSWDFDNIEKGKFINSGYMQVLNFICTIELAEEPSVVIIDLIERSLHILLQDEILNLLSDMRNVKKLIVTSHSPSVFNGYYDRLIDIRDCVDLGRERDE